MVQQSTHEPTVEAGIFNYPYGCRFVGTYPKYASAVRGSRVPILLVQAECESTGGRITIASIPAGPANFLKPL